MNITGVSRSKKSTNAAINDRIAVNMEKSSRVADASNVSENQRFARIASPDSVWRDSADSTHFGSPAAAARIASPDKVSVSSDTRLNSKSLEFWELMRDYVRACLKQSSLTVQQNSRYFLFKEFAVENSAATNLRLSQLPDCHEYHKVESVVFFCQLLLRVSYIIYEKRVKRKKGIVALSRSLCQMLRPYLLRETDEIPGVIDVDVSEPEIYLASSLGDVLNISLSNGLGVVPDASTSSGTSNIDENGVDVKEESYERAVYLEFLMNWLVQTGSKFNEEVNTENEHKHAVVITIESLPASHFFGIGKGSNKKTARWSAAHDIVRRLYHAGLVPPVLYHTIDSKQRVGIFGKIKRNQRAKEWQHVVRSFAFFQEKLLAYYGATVKSQNDLSDEYYETLEAIIESTKSYVMDCESKLNNICRRKRKAVDELEIISIIKRREIISASDESIGRKTLHENMTTRDNELLNTQASTSTANIGSDATLLDSGLTKDEEAFVRPSSSPALSGISASSPNSKLVYYNDLNGEEEDMELIDEEDDEITELANVATAPTITPTVNICMPLSTSSLEPKYQKLCSTLGVVCNEQSLAVYQRIMQIKKSNENGFKMFNDHIWQHFTLNGQDDRTFSWKMKVRQKLCSLTQQIFPTANVVAVGSTVNGCGSYNSDMDLCLCIPNSLSEYSTDRNYGISVLRKIQRKCSHQWHNVVRKVHFIPAKVPILKLEMLHPYDQLEIDMNCNNIAGIYNSHLIHYYARVDDRFPALCLLVKHWAINAGINDAMTGTLNSYSLILMVLHFLQCAVMPPVLPNLQKLYPEKFNQGCSIDKLELFRDFPYPLPAREINRNTIGELIIAFFDYYSKFNFKNNAISVRRGCVFDRMELCESYRRYKIFIEEPFDLQNTARCVTKLDNLKSIIDAFYVARGAFLSQTAGVPKLQNIDVH